MGQGRGAKNQTEAKLRRFCAPPNFLQLGQPCFMSCVVDNLAAEMQCVFILRPKGVRLPNIHLTSGARFPDQRTRGG